MKAIELLVREHDNILRMLDVMHLASLRILDGGAASVEDFKKMVDFIRKYADKAHHGKEEEFLFKEMARGLGATGETLVRNGMLVEHDIGRLYVSDLDSALDAYAADPSPEARLCVLVAAGSYERLLRRHIEKENDVIFPFGEKRLPEEALLRIEEQTMSFELDETNIKESKRQLRILDELLKKYER